MKEIYKILEKSKEYLAKQKNNSRILAFNVFENLGYHLTPNHYYSPIPDTKSLEDNLWLTPSKLNGIKIDEKAMHNLLYEFSKFKKEYEMFSREKSNENFYINNTYFESVDSEIYYCMIRKFKPKRIIEVGAGFSTFISSNAILKNKEEFNIDGKLTAIEPYPREELINGFPGLSKLIKSKVQSVNFSVFGKLEKNDILFIDSSHVAKMGGDVLYLMREIIPKMKKGVIIHIHDIFIPFEYPKEWIFKWQRFWNEQYLLESFLMFNTNFEIMWASNYMHMYYPKKLKHAFNSYENYARWPSSFWMRRV